LTKTKARSGQGAKIAEFIASRRNAEAADAQIDRIIERRAAGRDPDEERRQIYAASVERYNAREEASMRAAWAEYHEGQAERLETTAQALAAEHRARAQKLREEVSSA
jgi:hypothetical protein